VPQLPRSAFHAYDSPSDPTRGDVRGMTPLRLLRHVAPLPPGLPATRQDRDVAFEALLRAAARESRLAAPPDLSASIHDSLSRMRIEAQPQPHHITFASHLADVPFVLGEAWSHTRMLVHYHDLSERQRRVALGGAGTLGLAVLCLLGLALDPSEVFAVLGLLSALVLSLFAVGHLLSATIAAILGSGLLAIAAIALYAGLAALWIQLVRRPVEA
jgi:hypothetical protein